MNTLSTYEFGYAIGQHTGTEKAAGLWDNLRGMIGGAAKALPVEAAARAAAKAPRLNLATAHPAVAGALAAARGVPLTSHPDVLERVMQYGLKAPRPVRAPEFRPRMLGVNNPVGSLRFGATAAEQLALAKATARFEHAQHALGNLRIPRPRAAQHIIDSQTVFGLPAGLKAIPQSWGALKGVAKAAT